MKGMYQQWPIEFPVDGSTALAEARRVKQSGGNLVYADASDESLGTLIANVQSGETLGSVLGRELPGIVYMIGAGAFAAGAYLYGADDGMVDDTPTGKFEGIAIEACTGAGGRIAVRRVTAPPVNFIADPGNGGTINVGWEPINLVKLDSTGGAAAETLGAPKYAGQRLTLQTKTDGGDITITYATGVNQTGNDTLVTQDEGDCLELDAIELDDGSVVWRAGANDGFALSTAG